MGKKKELTEGEAFLLKEGMWELHTFFLHHWWELLYECYMRPQQGKLGREYLTGQLWALLTHSMVEGAYYQKSSKKGEWVLWENDVPTMCC